MPALRTQPRLQCNHFLQTKVRVLIPGRAGPQAARARRQRLYKTPTSNMFSDCVHPLISHRPDGVYLLNLPNIHCSRVSLTRTAANPRVSA